MKVQIRKEQLSDVGSIEALVRESFSSAPHSGFNEHLIVNGLRKAGALSISLTAVTSQKLVGYVAISPVTISDGTPGWYGLGPICVKPDEQGKGIGSQLMRESLQKLKSIGARGCVVLGEPEYYGRFGFKHRPELTLADVPQEYFQAILLEGELPHGKVMYPPAFNVTE